MSLRLAVLFGGVSLEHEVSVITAVQLMKQVDSAKYQLMPIYIDKSGRWWTGESLTALDYYREQNLTKPTGLTAFTPSVDPNQKWADVAILCFHGNGGESGSVQAVLELANIPYQGPGVTSSAVCFDKIFTRQVLAAESIGQTEYVWCTAHDWQTKQAEIVERVEKLGYPIFVKAANSGSSIGVVQASDRAKLESAVEEVLALDQRVLFEKAIKDCIEINVSVLGNGFDEPKTSVPEQPLKSEELLSFADKYQRGGKKSGMASAQRRIPAPISSRLTKKLQDAAAQLFKLFDCSGVVRIDFFANPSTEEWYVTELNTIPGSMSFYLWQASGIPYPQLIDELVKIAQERTERQSKLVRMYQTDLLKTAKA